MHKINVLAFGSPNFNTSLEELKDYLNFNLNTINGNIENLSLKEYDILFIHEDYFIKNSSLDYLNKIKNIKILAYISNNIYPYIFTEKILLPVSISDLNRAVENSITKKNFNSNSSIKIKNYILDKNEKKLVKNNIFILLTEKEIQLLELFLTSKKGISKNNILNKVWKYAADADTHTVETHIYRLRKKIKANFSDEDFILNTGDGYLL